MSKWYDGVVTNTQTMMRMHQTPVMVIDLLVIWDRYKYMKDQGILKKDPEETFFAKKFKGTCNKCGRLLEQERQGRKRKRCIRN